MFITVKYGDNKDLICNPSCAVVNLLNNIKRRCGLGNSNVVLDLSDETGLVKDLDIHRRDYASKHLFSHKTYILVQKTTIPVDPSENPDAQEGNLSPQPPQYNFTPLLEDWQNLFPEYKLHIPEATKKRKARTASKSPSPAGKMTSKSKRKSKIRK
ncbi:unnamed protein product [Owenia fusiformis]|uniref:Uncharacterized protein n=1 Tax=Owenia fusiformis TaxID=6347 RepID=A0A8J1XX26_OWEFU|nr:unnamed protein product [Owenia fusiformis]